MPITPEFETALERLRDPDRPPPTATLYQLSDLGKLELAALEAAWPTFAADRRASILSDLNEISEANFELNFEAVQRLALDDESPAVRAAAIRGLWEAEDPSLVPPMLDFLRIDPDIEVRAAAASGLGRFVYLGQMEELPEAQVRRVEEALLEVIGGLDDLEVRRRALEAIAYSDRPEVRPVIAEAYDSDETLMRVSALFAMGRTSDERWAETVQAELENPDPQVRFEAARTAGELELSDAASDLAQLTEDEDPEVRDAAIWSLSQVGGTIARQALTALLEQTEDENEQEYIQEALENLDYSDEMQEFALLDFDADDMDDDVDDLDDDDGEEEDD